MNLAWLLGGKLAAEMKNLNGFVARSETAIANMLQRTETASGREALIAGGIALALAKDGKSLTMQGKTLESWLIGELKNHRAEISQLSNEYTMASLDKQIEIRDTVLRKGLPGDPLVRRMWVMRSATTEK